MRYIGGKNLILDKIFEAIDSNNCEVSSVLDMFCGSTVVANAFKKRKYGVITNDLLYFSYVLSRGTVVLNDEPKFDNLGIENPLEYFNNLTLKDTNFVLDNCFIYKNYSPNDDCERMYFQNDNAVKIDIIRKTIENWKNQNRINEDEYFYLLARLLDAIPYVSNIAGVYGAYLKHWDKRTYNNLCLKKSKVINNFKTNFAYNEDANDLAGSIYADLTYIDPPYNSRQYLPNYHILETVAKYDNPAIQGITGMREYKQQKSLYCKKSKVAEAFWDLLSKLDTKYILISYNNEGLLSTVELSEIVKQAGLKSTFMLYEFDYRRYKSKIPNNAKGLKEQLYFIRKR